MEGMEANVDTASAVLSDFREIRRDFSSDEFTEGIRNQLQGLEVGQDREFRGLSREQRRKVHLLAGELGMLSQSFSLNSSQQIVVVTNPPSISESRGRQTVEMDVKQLVAQIGEEVKEIQGTLQQSQWQVVSTAGVLVLGSVLSPWLLGKVGAELFLPLATGTVGLATAWQETAGKGAVAVAKRQSAFFPSHQRSSSRDFPWPWPPFICRISNRCGSCDTGDSCHWTLGHPETIGILEVACDADGYPSIHSLLCGHDKEAQG